MAFWCKRIICTRCNRRNEAEDKRVLLDEGGTSTAIGHDPLLQTSPSYINEGFKAGDEDNSSGEIHVELIVPDDNEETGSKKVVYVHTLLQSFWMS